MWTLLLIPLLFLLFTWVLFKWQRENFSLKESGLILGFRIFLGCVYGFIFARYFNGDDTWYFHRGSLEEQQKLMQDPVQFFADLNPLPAFERNEGFWKGWYYYLSDLEFWLLTKPMAFFNFISRGNYYVNVVFFNFMTCWGSVWLYRLFSPYYPEKKKELFFFIFLFPIPLFWMTGIRAEGWLLFFLALALLSFTRWMQAKGHKPLLLFFIALGGLIVLRSVLVFILLPVLMCWWLQEQRGWKGWKAMALVFGISGLLFWGSRWIDPVHNMPQLIVEKQAAFFALHGQTRFELDTLEATPGSFLKLFPQAITNIFVRPYVWEAKGFLQWVYAGSVLLLWVLVLLFIWQKSRQKRVQWPLLITNTFLFGLLLYVFIGYTVPFPGAIIRYKSLGEYFLLFPLFMGVNWRPKQI